jgi:hypothetical protein
MASFFKGQFVKARVGLPASAGQQRAQLHRLGKVDEESYDEQGQMLIKMTLTTQQWDQVKTWPELVSISRID